MDQEQFPEVNPALVKVLEELYPERTPDLHETLDQIRWRGGQQDIIRLLRNHCDEQMKPTT
jgi:hypothetical protein